MNNGAATAPRSSPPGAPDRRSVAYDAIIVGSGPNGLAAAITLARTGLRVAVFEGQETVGGGMRTAELTLPGFRHDVCSAFHPLGIGSPFFRTLPLEKYGLEWIQPTFPLAHPLPDGTAAVLQRSVAATAATLGDDGERYIRMLEPFVNHAPELLEGILAPIRLPRALGLMARFGRCALHPATHWTQHAFRHDAARALFAGNAAHSFLPLSQLPSGAVGLMLLICGHAFGWPVARGGSGAIAQALSAYLRELGGEIFTGTWIRSLAELPPARAVVCDVAPSALERLAGDRFPNGFRRQLRNYRHGPAAFKIDWALNGAIPWTATACGKAGTVHVGGTAAEIAAAENTVASGRLPDRPFVLVGQQSLFDPTRAPAGGHTAWGYGHVPTGSGEDATGAIEQQIERFAPGFRARIVQRVIHTPADLERHNPNYVGGDISCGAQDWRALLRRSVRFRSPYATPDPEIFLCSAATPPGPGVHGMCGWHAAQRVLAQHFNAR